MAEVIRETRTVEHRDNDDLDRRDDTSPSLTTVMARAIYLLTGLILTLLAFRFLLALLGASRGSPFTNFIYSTSETFVSPFFGIFNYQAQVGVSRFEVETLVAMLFYAFIGWLLVRLITLGSRSGTGSV